MNNDEFILSPPIALANTAGPNSKSLKSKRKKKLAEFKILQPDHTLHSFRLPIDAKGSDCIDQICDILGIVEKDYFGLYFIDTNSGYKIWINKRLQIKHQVKQKPPFELFFAVKFYTETKYLLQTQTIEAFFHDVKYQIKRGDIHVPNAKKGLVGAHIAQADLGDLDESQGMQYSPCFQNWNSGIAHIIRKEHLKLKGISRRQAQLLLIQSVYDLYNYGMQYVHALVNNENVIVGIGAKYVRIFTTNWRCKFRVPFGALIQVAFGNKFFSFMHLIRDSQRNLVEKKVTCYVYNHTLARSLFRMVTEDQVFHYQSTVPHMVINHADNRETLWRTFCRKVLHIKYPKKYYYDIERTKKEVYRINWQILNQVAADPVSPIVPEDPPGVVVDLSNPQSQDNVEEECDPEKVKRKAEIWWGLSESSKNLARSLLPSDFITLSPSKDLIYFEQGEVPDKSPKEAPADEITHEDMSDTAKLITDKEKDTALTKLDSTQPLTKAQGHRMYKFLMKIQDEKMCSVCMDELISCVFCPCGHYAACTQCAKKLDKCPVCRELIGYVQFVYSKSF